MTTSGGSPRTGGTRRDPGTTGTADERLAAPTAAEPAAGAPVAAVLGAGPGLGLATARRFGRAGYEVALLGRSEPALAELGGSLAGEGIVTGWAVTDVADARSLTRALSAFVDHKGRLDVLHHNVSRYREGRVMEVDAADLLADLAIGTASLVTAVRAVLPALQASRGCVLATGGGAADRPITDALTLGVQKAALRTLVETLAPDLAERGVLATTVMVRGLVAEGTRFAPERVADALFAAAEQRHRPAEEWQTVREYPG